MPRKRQLLRGYDAVAPLYVLGGVLGNSVQVSDGSIRGRWLRSSDFPDRRLKPVVIDLPGLCVALEDFLNMQMDDDSIASFIHRHGITLNVPFRKNHNPK